MNQVQQLLEPGNPEFKNFFSGFNVLQKEVRSCQVNFSAHRLVGIILPTYTYEAKKQQECNKVKML